MRYLTFNDANADLFLLLTAALAMTDDKLTTAEMRTAIKVDAKFEAVSLPSAPPELGRILVAPADEVTIALEDAEHLLVVRMTHNVPWRAAARRAIVALYDLLEHAPSTPSVANAAEV